MFLKNAWYVAAGAAQGIGEAVVRRAASGLVES
jgi:hypothetical protein